MLHIHANRFSVLHLLNLPYPVHQLCQIKLVLWGTITIVGEGNVQRVSNVGEGVSKKVQLWGLVDELANINLIMGTGTTFNWGDMKKKKVIIINVKS